jgi:hypothetical protein
MVAEKMINRRTRNGCFLLPAACVGSSYEADMHLKKRLIV